MQSVYPLIHKNQDTKTNLNNQNEIYCKLTFLVLNFIKTNHKLNELKIDTWTWITTFKTECENMTSIKMALDIDFKKLTFVNLRNHKFFSVQTN